MDLLILWPWPLNPKTVPFLGYPKIIPYTKFEHFGINRFWVTTTSTLRTNGQTNRRTRKSYPRRPTVYSGNLFVVCRWTVGVKFASKQCKSIILCRGCQCQGVAEWLRSTEVRWRLLQIEPSIIGLLLFVQNKNWNHVVNVYSRLMSPLRLLIMGQPNPPSLTIYNSEATFTDVMTVEKMQVK